MQLYHGDITISYSHLCSYCPKYLPDIAISIFSITTSSSISDFVIRMVAHLRSKDLREAHVSASKGASTATQSAKSHRQLFLESESKLWIISM